MAESMNSAVVQSLAEAASLQRWLAENERSHRTLARFAEVVANCLRASHRVVACGNGGSMCDAMHFAEEMSGRFRQDRRALPVQAISDPSHLTAVGNDLGFAEVFARGIAAWCAPGDTLLIFSTSGNSPNIRRAAEAARLANVSVLGFLGRDGGAALPLCDLALTVPGATSDRIQEVHIQAVHIVIELVERDLFPGNYQST